MSNMLEALMLVCFGLSWPISVMKNYKSHTAKNMSLRFTLLIIAGYVAGITAKIYSHKINYVLAVYIMNLLIVSMNVWVYFKNKKIDSETGVTKTASNNVASVATMATKNKKQHKNHAIQEAV